MQVIKGACLENSVTGPRTNILPDYAPIQNAIEIAGFEPTHTLSHTMTCIIVLYA